MIYSSFSVTCHRSMIFSGYSSFLHQENWPPRYNWNIVESGIKYHNPNLSCIVQFIHLYCLCRLLEDGRFVQTIRLTIRKFTSENKWGNRESRQCPVPHHIAVKITQGINSFVKETCVSNHNSSVRIPEYDFCFKDKGLMAETLDKIKEC